MTTLPTNPFKTTPKRKAGLFHKICTILTLLAIANLTVAKDLPSVRSAKLGFSPERLERIDAAVNQHINAGDHAGMVILVARHGKVAYHKAFGLADIESNKAMQEDALFRLYSMTKPITSVALLTLYEQGKFQLTDPLDRYIPEFKDLKVYAGLDSQGGMKLEALTRKPTVQDVLRHTAGFSYGFGSSPVDKAYQAAGVNFGQMGSLQDLINKLAQLPLLYQPGTQWVYSVAHDVQAYLVEKISGQPFADYVTDNILKPLGMTDTIFGIPSTAIPRYTTNYTPSADGAGLTATDRPGKTVNGGAVGPVSGSYAYYTTHHFGGLSLSSTASDYARFGIMLLNGGELNGQRILGRKTVELMRQNHLPPAIPNIGMGPITSPGVGYGLGVSVITDEAQSGVVGSKGNFGWSGAASTHAIFDPVEDMVIITLVQLMPTDMRIRDEIATLTYQALID